jgi:hypothetical protein
MPPKVLDPSANGFTTHASYYFIPTNAHGIHPPTSVYRWKVTVTTGPDGSGTLITQTGWYQTPIGTCLVNNLPANNSYPWTQIIYEKPAGGGTFTSFSNQFQSRP